MSILSLAAEILFVGHSLVSHNLPPVIEAAWRQRGLEAEVQAQIINGAPLRFNWDNAALAEGVDARSLLPLGGTDVLVLTEGIPLAGNVTWNDTVGSALAFAGLAWAAKPDTQVFLYETWHSLDSAPGATVPDDPGGGVDWRDRLTADLPVWQDLVAGMNAGRPEGAPPVRLVPAGQAMGLMADAISAGQVPGLTSIEGLFRDDIHPNDKGLYLVAMVHLAAITGEDPQGLPARLMRQWTSRAAMISEPEAQAMQRAAWEAVQRQRLAEQTRPQPAEAEKAALAPVAEVSPPAVLPPAESGFTPITNPSLGFGLAGVHDWSTQQPFLDVMKTSRSWIGHLPGQWGGWTHDDLAAGGWLDENGWPKLVPPPLTGISTLVLTDLPVEASHAAGRYLLSHDGRGVLRIEGRAREVQVGGGIASFDFTPGEGGVVLTIEATDPQDPIRNIVILREDRWADHVRGMIFNPDWLNRIRGARMVRFMDWMATNDSPLARLEDRPLPGHYSWGRMGVPVEVMVALANELQADPWFTLPHMAEDALVRFYAETVRDGLAPGLRAHVEYSNEVWNWQFGQARWADEQAQARWGQQNAWLQFYGLRAAEVAGIWTDAFGDAAVDRLVRVIATQTVWLGLEEDILNAPLVVAEGLPPPRYSFDAYAVTGYFSGGLGHPDKEAMVKGWLAESLAAAEAEADALGLTGAARAAHVMAHRHNLAFARAAQELADGTISGRPEDTLSALLEKLLPYQATVARRQGMQLVMYEGGTHVVGQGPLVDDADLTDFFTQLNYAPDMGLLFEGLLQGWAELSDAPFNAFVDVSRPGRWGSWGALRHLNDENPRWRTLAKGCVAC